VTTLPEGGSAGLSAPSSYRFALNLPMLSPPHFTELHVNTLFPNPPGSHGRGLFYTEPRRKLLALELGAITVQEPMTVFTLHTLYVLHDAFLSYIAAHPAPPPAPQPGDPISDTTVDVPWEAWGPSHTRLVTVPNVAHSRYLGLHKVCGMHALSEPPILLERGILRIMDYRPSRGPPVAEQGESGAGEEPALSLPDTTSGGSTGEAQAHSLPDPTSGNTGEAQVHSLPVSPNGSTTEDPRGPPVSSGDDAIANLQGQREVPPPPPPPPPTPPDTAIPYSVKDIPLPNELLRSDSVRCVLCEDVVVLFEVGTIHLILAPPTTQLRSFLWATPNNPAKG